MNKFLFDKLIDLAVSLKQSWLNHFDKCPSALFLMSCKPKVLRAGWQVFRSLYNSVKRRFVRANLAVAEPYMLPAVVDFVVKLMVDAEPESCHAVNFNHFVDEIWTVAVDAIITFVLCLREEQPRVYHFMQQRF